MRTPERLWRTLTVMGTEETDPETESERSRKWIDETIPAATGTGAAVVAASVGIDPAAASFVGLSVNRAVAGLLPSLRRRLEALHSSIRRPWEGVEDPEAEFWARVQARESAQEVWFLAATRLHELVSPLAAEMLGVLVRDYVERDAFPDRLFHATCRTLREIQSDEIGDLQTLLARLMEVPEGSPLVRASVDAVKMRVRFTEVDETTTGRVFKTTPSACDYRAEASTAATFRLMARTGLARPVGTEVSGCAIDLERTVAGRLSQIFKPTRARSVD